MVWDLPGAEDGICRGPFCIGIATGSSQVLAEADFCVLVVSLKFYIPGYDI